MVGWIPIGVLVTSVGLNIFLLLRGRSESADGVKVIGVIDGDTLVLEGKSKIRLRYVDAPELGFCTEREAKKAGFIKAKTC